MSIIKVGYDYDEPVFPWYDYAHDVSVAAGLTTMEQDPPTMWDPTTVYGCTLDEWYEVINQEVLKGPAGMYGRPVKPGVVADMYRLKNRGVEIHLVTARGQFGSYGDRIKELTHDQIVKEKMPVAGVHFSTDKYQTIKDLGLDYFIDDRVEYYQQASRAGARSFLLDERWNQGYATRPGRRVYSTRQYVDRIVRDLEQPTWSQIASRTRVTL